MSTTPTLPLGYTGKVPRDLAFSEALKKVSPQAQQPCKSSTPGWAN